MQQPKLFRRGGDTVFGIETTSKDIEQWRATITQVRECIQNLWVTAPDFSDSLPLLPESKHYLANQREVETTAEMCQEAVNAGRLIDFGWMPNNVIKFGGNRGGELWNRGGLSMPFSEPWVLYHEWEGGVCVYLVNPLDPGHRVPTGEFPGDIRIAGEGFEVCELSPMRFGINKCLAIQDRGRIFKMLPDMPQDKYWAHVAPSHTRFWADPELYRRANELGTPQSSAAGNIGDPVMAALLMLGTRNILRETIHASEKLQRARKRRNHPPIPPYEKVHSATYVTAISNRGRSAERGEGKGGTHRSPVAHVRMGHPREYSTGRTIFIADTLVNVPEDQRATFKATRSHYDASRMDRPIRPR